MNGNLFGYAHNNYLLCFLKTGWRQNNSEIVFLSLLGIVLIEAIMDFMLSDKIITMKYSFYFYLVMIFLIFSFLLKVVKKESLSR